MFNHCSSSFSFSLPFSPPPCPSPSYQIAMDGSFVYLQRNFCLLPSILPSFPPFIVSLFPSTRFIDKIRASFISSFRFLSLFCSVSPCPSSSSLALPLLQATKPHISSNKEEGNAFLPLLEEEEEFKKEVEEAQKGRRKKKGRRG